MTGSGRRGGPSLTGTLVLLRLNLRLDRVRLLLWIGGLTAMVVVSAASVDGLYTTDAEIAGYFALMEGNPTLTAINGPGFGAAAPNIGAILVNEVLLFGSIGFALMAVFLVVRHTRGEEEAERTDLLRSRMLGRDAGLVAAAIVGVGASLITGLASWVGLLALGFAPAGSGVLCAAMAFTGLVFAGVAAVAAQLTTSARGALGLATGVLGVSYLLRAVGDVGSGALSWVSPLGWAHRVRPFAGEQWWVLALQVAVAALLFGAANRLADRRDLGSGLIPQRPGPAHASRGLGRPVGLAVRLQRGALVGWSIGLFVLGVVYGSVGSDIERIFEETPEAEDFIALDTGSIPGRLVLLLHPRAGGDARVGLRHRFRAAPAQRGIRRSRRGAARHAHDPHGVGRESRDGRCCGFGAAPGALGARHRHQPRDRHGRPWGGAAHDGRVAHPGPGGLGDGRAPAGAVRVAITVGTRRLGGARRGGDHRALR